MYTIEDLNEAVARVKSAQRIFSTFPQEKVDDIFKKATLAANN